MGGMRGDAAFSDEFDVAGLDTAVWVPHYLPMWSSRADSAAAYEIADSELRLTIPPDHGLWCAEDHEPALRVSGIQSGVHSGAVGSTVGQQPFREGAVVREAQETLWGWTPFRGRLEIRARMELSPRSMAAVWMVGLEDRPSAAARSASSRSSATRSPRTATGRRRPSGWASTRSATRP